jgi:radical SAM protein with 4Fe4S-binding SPASM domain
MDFMQARVTSIYNAHIDVVHGCQLRCIGCPNSTLLPKIHRMKLENFRRILGNIDVDKIHTLRLFNFGEPLLHKELSKLVAVIPEQKFKTSIVEISTNAQQVYWDDFEEVVRLEVVNKLVVSCDGDGTPEDYEAKRPPSKWENLIEFLERARVLRDRYAPAMQLMTSTVCVDPIQRKRWEDILLPRGWTPKFRRWMALPQSAVNMTGREPAIPASPCFYVANSDRFVSHKWSGQINLLYVDYDGTVVPCCQHPRAGVLGNLLENSYSDILFGKKRADFIEQLEVNRAEMPVCGACDVGPPDAPGPSFNAAMDT